MSSKKSSTKQTAQARGRADGFFAIQMTQARESLLALWRRPLGHALTLAVITIALTIPACFYLLGKNIAEIASHVATPPQVSAYLHKQVPEARIMILKDELETDANIKQVKYISSQQGLADLSQYTGFDQALSFVEPDTLPGVLVVTPNVEDPATMSAITQRLRAEADIADVRLDEDWLSRLDAIRNVVSTVVGIMSVLMLLSVFLIIGNTLRFNVLENKEAIQTMKLIGATDSYILRPYLYEGMWLGLLGAALAWILTIVIVLTLHHYVEVLSQLYDSPFSLVGLNWDESLLLLMLGTFIGVLAARLSAQHHLKEIEPV